MIRTADLVREGRDAVIAARINGNPPARNPYNRHTKRHLFWKPVTSAELAKLGDNPEITASVNEQGGGRSA